MSPFPQIEFRGSRQRGLLVPWIAIDSSTTIYVFSTVQPNLPDILSDWNNLRFLIYPRFQAKSPPLNCCELAVARQKAPAVD